MGFSGTRVGDSRAARLGDTGTFPDLHVIALLWRYGEDRFGRHSFRLDQQEGGPFVHELHAFADLFRIGHGEQRRGKEVPWERVLQRVDPLDRETIRLTQYPVKQLGTE